MGGDLATSLSAGSNSTKGLGPLLAITGGISALGNIFSGVAANSAANAEAKRLELQGRLAQKETEFQAQQKARDVKKFAAVQTMQYLKSGVSLEGSPLAVLQDTLQLGQQEIDALRRHGDAVYNLYASNASQVKSQGRSALLGGFVNAIGGGLNTYMTGRRFGIFGNKANTSTVINNGLPPLPPVPFDTDPIDLRYR